MAKALDVSFASWLRPVWLLRLAPGFTIVFGSAISLIGTCWDIQWHTFVGRDRTLIPPHLMMLAGITLCGLVSLSLVLVETLWIRRNSVGANGGTAFAGLFSAPLGAYVAGFAALDGAIAFPLDSYWHALYGIDVVIWAPFHIMIISSMALMPLGAAYILLSGARMAKRAGDERTCRTAYIAATIALATMMSTFSLLLSDALDTGHYLHLGSVTINFFPLLAGLLVACVYSAVRYAIPWDRGASSVMLVYICFMLLFSLFVPTVTGRLLVLEHLQYRRPIGIFANFSVEVLLYWPLVPIVVAPLFDFFFSRAQRLHWSYWKRVWVLAFISMFACIPLSFLYPLASVTMVVSTGGIGTLLTFLLGLAGVMVGMRLGYIVGELPYQVEGA